MASAISLGGTGDANNSTSLYSSPIFKLIVGPDREVFTAHRAVLEKSYFFASCAQFKEGETLEILLPEDKPEHMERIVAWLYTSQLEYHRPRVTSDDSRPALIDLVSLYIVADKYFVSGLQMKIKEMFEKHFNLQGIDTAFAHHSFFSLLRAAGLSDPDLCPLTNLLLEKLATDLRRHGWNQYINEVDSGLAEELVEDPNLMVKLVQRLADSNAYVDHALRSRKKLKREHSNLGMGAYDDKYAAHSIVTID
ncbi:hypothetical protein H2200_004959 [Cladophialophora chaetospira]|uniref:BTB domain-containing protein n=1 Tax=Cladophialophora chaetospira TaxID=386627 RepID=A0AA38XE83_9EURO|nr:hypothetical protein H2200_004959 [Cladophialophora chaetospira]